MHVIVCGGRDYLSEGFVRQSLDRFRARYRIDTLHTGGATGADTLAADWARLVEIPFAIWEAHWKIYDKAAGPIRNQEMLDNLLRQQPPHCVIAFPGGAGTDHMCRLAAGKLVPIWKPAENPDPPNLF